MQNGVLAVLLAAIFSLFSCRVQDRLRAWLHARPAGIWGIAALLCGLFLAIAGAAGEFSFGLAALVGAYIAAPVAVAYWMGAAHVKRPRWGDFAIVLLLWLPLEFAAGAQFVSKHAQGFLHSLAYGVAILLALVLYLGFRSITGMKYNLPRGARDLWLPLLGFALVAPVLIVLGVWMGFMPPFHVSPKFTPARYGLSYLVVFAGTGLPEEILFRSLIQNFLMQTLGSGEGVLLLASAIFGAAHLDNGPLPLPNWRYAILATIAGYAYGKVFKKSSTVLSSSGFHAMLDTTKHFFF